MNFALLVQRRLIQRRLILAIDNYFMYAQTLRASSSFTYSMMAHRQTAATGLADNLGRQG
jgi:hypothetical protein